jgi:glycosyltransferase involved in cell wall biosynthesis
MKILLINKSDRTGGAAVACMRLFRAHQKNKLTVNVLVQEKLLDEPAVISTTTGWISRKINFLRFAWERLLLLYNIGKRENLFAFSPANTGENIAKVTAVQQADILHLHWFNQGFLSLKSLRQLIKLKKPIIWTLHDMWAFTGGCHYSGNCSFYKKKCGFCHFLKNADEFDLSSRVFQKKRKLLENADMTIVTCSKWLADKAKESSLLTKFEIVNIPNPIDTEIFAPKNKLEARKALNLPADKKLILFGAANVLDKRKGIGYLVDAVELLIEKNPEHANKTELVLFGKSNQDISGLFELKINQLNHISSTIDLVNVYNACDLFVLPSLEDNLPNTVMEAMACGVPVVAFHTGGLPEMVEHQKTGYLAEFKNETDFANGINWVLVHANSEFLAENCRNKTLTEYSESVVSAKYQEVYRKALSRKLK